MKPSKTRTPGEKQRATAPQNDAGNASDAGLGGGAPATEEDIGTEGRGTEPRSSSDEEHDRGPSSQNPRHKNNVR